MINERDAQTSDGSERGPEPEPFESPSLNLAASIAEITGSELESMPPLYDAVDTDALDTILESESTIEVTFEYDGHTVEVTDDEVLVDGRGRPSEYLPATETAPSHRGAERGDQYLEYDVGDDDIGIIYDPDAEHAWVWSDSVESATR